jgi:hypothetical protein
MSKSTLASKTSSPPPPPTPLDALVARVAKLRAEHARLESEGEALNARREKVRIEREQLLKSLDFDDPRQSAAVAQMQLQIDIIPSRVSQIVEALVALESELDQVAERAASELCSLLHARREILAKDLEDKILALGAYPSEVSSDGGAARGYLSGLIPLAPAVMEVDVIAGSCGRYFHESATQKADKLIAAHQRFTALPPLES